MAYSDDISGLGADHHWDFDGDSVDGIGALSRVDTTMAYTGSPLAKDATNSAVMDARTDKVVLGTATTVENAANARKAMAGWFMVDDVELPHCIIYTEGIFSNNFQFVLFAGNSVVFEVRNGANFDVQVYSDIALAANRVYHLCGIFEGSGYGNEVRFYLDGVKQLQADPSDRQPDYATMAARTQVGIFGDPTVTHTDVGVGGLDYEDDIKSPGDNRSTEQIINAYYQHWCAWGDEADAVLTDTEVRETLFEKGALADVTISGNTQVNMQSALDGYSSTTRSDAPLCFEIEAVSGGGDFTLDVDDITFNDLASCHIRYNGTADTLTLRNVNGSNCSIVAAPFGGNVTLFTEVTVQVTAKSASDLSVISGARVLLLADSGGDLPYEDSVSITRSGSTATVTHTSHGLSSGAKVLISGANEVEYNGVQTITVTGVNTYTYTVSGTPDSPATGTITGTAVIISDTTNGSGIASVNFDYSSDQPVTGKIRQGTSSIYFVEGSIAGIITTNGLDTTILLVEDE